MFRKKLKGLKILINDDKMSIEIDKDLSKSEVIQILSSIISPDDLIQEILVNMKSNFSNSDIEEICLSAFSDIFMVDSQPAISPLSVFKTSSSKK